MKIGLTARLVLSHAAVALVAVVVFSTVLIFTTGPSGGGNGGGDRPRDGGTAGTVD